MKTDSTDGQMNEQALVQIYMNLMGTTESHARNVLMYLDGEERDLETGSGMVPTERGSSSVPGRQ
jgi:hypothetical protein